MNAQISSDEKWQVASLTTVQHVDSTIETPFGIEAGENIWWKERPANVTDMVRETQCQIANRIVASVPHLPVQFFL